MLPLDLGASPPSPLDSFSMGFYYLYNEDLAAAFREFKQCVAFEEDPPALLYIILSQISDMMGLDDESELYARKALEIDPDNEDGMQVMALIQTRKGSYEEAVGYLEKLVQKRPDDVQLLYYLAESYRVLERDDDLVQTYEQLLKYRPDLIEAAIDLGFLYTKKGDLESAEKMYGNVLEKDPSNEKALFYLTYIYLSRGRTADALQYFKELDDRNLLNDATLEDYGLNLFIEGQNPIPVLERIENHEDLSDTTKAVLFLHEGRLDEAASLFEKALEEDPYSVIAPYGLVSVAEKREDPDEKKWRFMLAGNYYRLHIYDRALEQALKVKALDRDYLDNRYLLGDIHGAMGDTDKALREYEYYVKNAVDPGEAYVKLGIAHDTAGNHEKALEYLREAVRLYPEKPELFYYLGIEYRILEDYEGAIEAFERAVELDEENAAYYFHLGVSYERYGDIQRAIEYLDKSILLDDSNPTALNYLGYLLADTGVRLEEAKTYIERALSEDPNNGAYLDSMGWVYYRLADFSSALEYMTSAVQFIDLSNEENYLIYEHLGDVHYELKNYDDAIDAWKRALELKAAEGIMEKIEKTRKEGF